MKKFIIKVFIFILPALLPLLVVEMLIRHIPNDYKNKNDYMLSDKAKHIETLILGSSHTHLGINPQYLETNAYNLAFIGENIEYTIKVFENYKSRLQSVKTIVLPISYHSLYSNSMSKKWLKNYAIYYNLKISDFPVDNLEILNKSLTKIKNELTSYYIEGEDSLYLKSDSVGWRSYMEPNVENYAEVAKKVVNRHTRKDIGQLHKNINLLSQFFKQCQLNNIRVILITTPYHQEYINAMDKTQWETTVDNSKLLASSFDNVSYYNFYNDKRFTQDDFKDGDHLNEVGARKLSSILNLIINRT